MAGPYQGEQQGKEKPPLWRRGPAAISGGIGGVAPLPYCAPAPEHATGLSFNYRVRQHRSPPCAKGGQHGKAMQGGL